VVYVRVISPLRSYTETKGKRQKMVFNPLEPKVRKETTYISDKIMTL
jgi:hypothetical protein